MADPERAAVDPDLSGAARPAQPAWRRPSPVAATVLVVGLALTAFVSWTTWRQYEDAESRLLVVQARQAAEVVVASTSATQAPLAGAAQLAATSGGSARQFRHYMAGFVGDPGGFAGASLWVAHGRHLVAVAGIGIAPERTIAPRALRRLADAALRTNSFSVALDRVAPRRLVFVDARRSPTGGYVVLAERPVPPDAAARISSNAAFADLRYAIYFGRRPMPANLVSGNIVGDPPAGSMVQLRVPYGAATLTLVATPVGSLAGNLPARRPLLLVTFGGALSVGAAVLVQRLVGRRRAAERDSREISTLNAALADLYAEQRTIALTLQRSLLPVATPDVPGLQVAVRYLPGSGGAEVGGDWYSVIPIDDDRFAFVIGDVSGRGVRAAAVMAALRFTIRTLLLEGHGPGEVLEMAGAQTRDIVADQLATVLVGVGSLAAGSVQLASAGHLPPLVVAHGVATYVELASGVPIGAPGRGYPLTEVPTPPGTTLLAFTDGLIERRGRGLSAGLDRLASEAGRAPRDLEAFVTRLCDRLTEGAESDDVAVLAVRWGRADA